MPSSKKRTRENPKNPPSLPSGKDRDVSKGDYAVGRGKPPKHTQFKKGDGRHRPGRPKGTKNMVTMVLEAARDQVPVAIDGKKRKISKAQAAAINLANAAATGNPKFVLQFIDLIAGIEARAEAARPSAYPFSEVDKKVIHEIYKRLRPYDGQVDD
jgi:hypothetical protein